MTLERLGDSDAWGDTLLWVLRRDGWLVTRRPMLGGGQLVVARKSNIEVRAHGERLVDAAREAFARARRARLRAAA